MEKEYVDILGEVIDNLSKNERTIPYLELFLKHPESISGMASTVFIQKCRNDENGNGGRPPTMKAVKYMLDLREKASPEKLSEADRFLEEKNVTHLTAENVSSMIDLLK
jgi:Fe-S cluster assembly ATPase SufC